MVREEFNKLFKKLETEYKDFNGDYDEWFGVLIEYNYQDILKKLNERSSTTAPIHTHLIKGLKKEEKIEDWITCCDICKERITIHNNDMSEFDKHYRKCQKIDFIDRMSQRKTGERIERANYYNMQEELLERVYQKALEYYREQPKNDLIKTL